MARRPRIFNKRARCNTVMVPYLTYGKLYSVDPINGYFSGDNNEVCNMFHYHKLFKGVVAHG